MQRIYVDEDSDFFSSAQHVSMRGERKFNAYALSTRISRADNAECGVSYILIKCYCLTPMYTLLFKPFYVVCKMIPAIVPIYNPYTLSLLVYNLHIKATLNVISHEINIYLFSNVY